MPNKKCSTLIKNAFIATADSVRTTYDRGAIAISDGRISDIGPEEDVSIAYSASEVVDAGGALVHPGFIDTHTHLTLSLLRTLVAEAPGLELSNTVKLAYGYVASIEPEEEFAATLLSAGEHLLAGYTQVVDPGTIFSTAAAAEAIETAGIRAVFGDPFLQDQLLPGREIDRAPASLDRCRQLIGQELSRNQNEDGLIRGQIALYGSGTATALLVREAIEMARHSNVPFTMHQSLSLAEHEAWTQALGGVSPFAYWAKHGALGESATMANFVHCNVVDDAEFLAATESKVSITWCPHNLLYYNVVPDVQRNMLELYRSGVNVTLGHDVVKCFQPGDLAMFAYIVSHMWHDALLPADLLEMQTINAARALGREADLGSLEIGKRADIVIRRPNCLGSLPPFDPVKSAMLITKSNSVDTVLVNGSIVVRNGRLTRIEAEEIGEVATRAAERIVGRHR